MAGMFITRLVASRTAAEQSNPMENDGTRAELTTHTLTDPFSVTSMRRFRIHSLIIKLRKRLTKRLLLSAAMRKYLTAYRLTRVEVSIRIGPYEKTLTRCYGSGSPKLSSALTFASSIISTRKLQLTVLKFFERRGSNINVLLFKFKSDN